MIKVESITNGKGNGAKNQYIIRTPKGLIFQSYNTLVAFYTLDRKGEKILYYNAEAYFSKTTTKYYNLFKSDFEIKQEKALSKKEFNNLLKNNFNL